MGKNKPNKPPAPTTKSKGSPKIVYAGVAMLVGAAAVAWQLYGGGAPPKVPEPPKTNRRQTTTTESPKKQQAAAKQQRSKPPSPPPPRPMVSGKVDPNCVDSDESCESWARSGECDRNQGFMHSNCRASCHICNGGKPKPKRANACEDSNTNCATWAAIGECQSNPGFMLQNCPVTCKMCQSETCKDELDDCTARCKGGIASNYSENLNCYYEPELVEKCAWTCGACKEHRFDKPQCERRKGTKPAATPGSVDKMFNRIKDDLPNAFTPGSGTTPSVNVLSSEPWVITIDDFLSSEECDDILKAGSHSGTAWGRSQAGDGVQAARTSSTAWCKGACLQHPTVQRVEQRVSDLLGGIPMDNAEPMQVRAASTQHTHAQP